MAHRARIDFAAAIEGADAGEQIAERKDALHRARLEPETVRDLLHRPSRLHQRDERFPLTDLVGLHPREILEHRRFERIGIVALVENGARDRFHRPAFARDGAHGGKAPTPCDDLVMAFRTIGANEQRNEHPARTDARHKVCDVGDFPLPAHVSGRDGQIAHIDKIELHDCLPSRQPHPAPDGGAGGEKRRRDRAKGRRAPEGPKRRGGAGHRPACGVAERSHSRAPTATLSVPGPTATPPCGQRGINIGEQTRPWRSRRRGGVCAQLCLAAAPPRSASQERCATNRAKARASGGSLPLPVRAHFRPRSIR